MHISKYVVCCLQGSYVGQTSDAKQLATVLCVRCLLARVNNIIALLLLLCCAKKKSLSMHISKYVVCCLQGRNVSKNVHSDDDGQEAMAPMLWRTV